MSVATEMLATAAPEQSPAEAARPEATKPSGTAPSMGPLERKAAFKAAVTLSEVTAAQAARNLKVSYNHLMLVLNGGRTGSERLRRAIAAFLGCTDVEVFGSRAQRVAPEPQSSTER